MLNCINRLALLNLVTKPPLNHVATPCVEEAHTVADANVPIASGPCIECEGCGHLFPDSGDCIHNSYDAVKKRLPPQRQMPHITYMILQSVAEESPRLTAPK